MAYSRNGVIVNKQDIFADILLGVALIRIAVRGGVLNAFQEDLFGVHINMSGKQRNFTQIHSFIALAGTSSVK